MDEKNKSLQQVIDFRIEKLNKIISYGIDPYPHKYKKTKKVSSVIENQDKYIDKKITVSGRIVSYRGMGKSTFIHIQESDHKIQAYLQRQNLKNDMFDKLVKNLDIGDIVGVEGEPFTTRTGEYTIRVSKIVLLSKSIRPLPNMKEKDGELFFSFDDKELRYRNRHLDLIINPDSRDRFVKRSQIISTIRSLLSKKDFMEVETPVLQPIYGGAAARPFITKHNTLDKNFYLRIAVELYLKRLVIGGFPRVYEMSKNFRNEGMDSTHNPEFTMLELYEAYSDIDDMIDITENIFDKVSASLKLNKVKFKGNVIDLSTPFRRVSMSELFEEYFEVDVDFDDIKQLRKIAKKINLDTDGDPCSAIIENIFGNFIERNLIQPTFVIDYPKCISPLAKVKRGSDGSIVERFELFIGGYEFANAFSELNDPIDQKERLLSQEKQRRSGDDEAHAYDQNFVEAMEIGMPPTGGVGIGIDRMVMLFTSTDSIKDVIFFPAMRDSK